MKTKHSVWKSKLAKTMFLMTVVLVAALFLGTAASAGLTSKGTTTQKQDVKVSQEGVNGLLTQARAATGLVPHAMNAVKTQQQTPLGDRGYFYAFNAYDPNGMANGPVTFDADGVVNLIQATGPNFISGSDFDPEGNWFAVGYAGGLYQTDPATGDMTYIAGTIALNSLVFDTSTSTWFASSSDLYTIDITTGATTLVGSFGIGNTIISLMCDASGNMYGYDVTFSGSSSLYSIDKSTGAATVIGSMGHTLCYAQEGKFDRNDGTLYLAAYDIGQGQSYLATCDPATGALTIINLFSPTGIEIDGFSVPYSLTQYDNDVGIKAVKAPKSGNAGVITPEVTVKNYGTIDQYGFPVEMQIAKHQYFTPLDEHFDTFLPTGWTQESPTEWYQQYGTYAGGTSPEAILWYYNVYDSHAYLESPAVDTSSVSSLTLSFKSNIYCWGVITPKVFIRSLSTDPYTDITPWVNPISTQQGPKTYTIDVSAFTGAQTQVQFEYSGYYGNFYYWALDDVKLTHLDNITEYDQTIYCSVPAGQAVNFTFSSWTPVDLGVSENMNIPYTATANTQLFGDENTNNDAKAKNFVLNFGYFNDVAITDVTSPKNGLAQTQTPQVVLANNGQNNENVNVNMVIGKATYSTLLTEDFSGGVPPAGWGTDAPTHWMGSSTNYAGGTAPEAEFYYLNSDTGDFHLYTAAIDTTGWTTAQLKFKEYVNDYNGQYTLKVQTSTDGGSSWNDAYTRAGGAYGPQTTTVTLGVADGVGSSNLMLSWTYSGNAYNINYWYIDDVWFGQVNVATEYDQTVVVDINAGQTMNVTLPDWTPSDIPLANSIDYIVTATATLNGFNLLGSYGFEDFVPPSGSWTQSAPIAWSQSFSAMSGGISPEARMSWSAAYDGCWFMSPAVDTTGQGTLTLDFKTYIDDYGGYADYSCSVQTRSSASDSWTDRTPWTNPVPGNIGPATYSIDISDDIGTGTQVRFLFNGVPFDIDYWYVDDVSFGGYSTDFSGSFPPAGAPGYLPGWTEEIVVPDPYGATQQWYIVTSGTLPTCSPHEGTYMAKYDSWDVGSGGESRLKPDAPIDLAATGYSNIVLKFWMNYYGNYGDYVDVQVSLDGSIWTSIGHFANDGTHGTGWVQNTVDLSAYASESAVYLAFLGVSNYMYNPFVDDITLLNAGVIPDGNPGDNVVNKIVTLSYEHDVGVAAITEPSGPYLKDDAWIKYDSGVESNAFGSTTGEIWAANRFTSAEVGAYTGWKLDTIMWNHYDATSISGTVEIYDAGTSTQPGAMITSEAFTVDGAGWFNITLSSPVTISGNDIWLCTHVTHPSGEYPDSCSAPGITTKTAWFSSDGATWYDLPSLGYDVAFMLRGHVASGGGPGEPWLPGIYPVAGIVKNLGVTFSESNFDVNTQITNGTNVVVYDNTVTVAGPLAPGATVGVTFPDITIENTSSAEGTYKVTMKTMLAGDDHTNNDKKTMTFEIQRKDITPPETTAALAGTMGQNNWYVSGVTVTLTAVDPAGPDKYISGVKNTYIKIDSGAWNLYTVPVVVTGDGQHTVSYYSDDNAGNVETTKTVSFKMDTTAPDINITCEAQNLLKTKWLIVATVDDGTIGSGVVLVEFYIADALVGNVTVEPWEFLYHGKDGPAQCIAYDAAGNSAMSNIAEVLVYEVQSQQSTPVLAHMLLKNL